MPDLPDRSQREQELAGSLAVLWAKAAANPTPDSVLRMHWAMPSSIVGTLERVYADAASQLADEIGAEVDQERISRAASAWATGYATKLSDDIHRTTAAMASDALSRQAAGQGNFAELMADAFSDARAELIAATEVTRAITAGEQGLVSYLVVFTGRMQLTATWHTAADDMVCDVCEPLNGTGEEVFGRVSLSGPPAHPRCRCWLDWGNASRN